MSLLYTALAVLCALGGTVLVHRAWKRRGGPGLTLAGWGLLFLALLPWRATGADWDRAAAFAALSPALVALILIAGEAEWRPGRKRTGRTAEASAADLPPSSGPLWRGLARTALAGPMAGVAALGLAVAVALRAPWSEADRLVAAGFLLPLMWAAAGVWATTDARLHRVTAGLSVLALAGFGSALL